MATILLLEPDSQLAKSYTNALQNKGHQVYWQKDAQAALGVLDEHSPELVYF